MPNTASNGITIEYETFGRRENPALLLVMGLGAQLTLWDPDFCGMLADKGHHVIRFDNRDVGLSTWFDEHGAPDILSMMTAMATGETPEVPYTLDDMADDAAGLLDALGIERAHICGASMGGMLVQTLAIRHPARVLSMTSIMSTTGNPEVPPASPEAMAVLTGPPPKTRDEAIENGLRGRAVIGSPGFPSDEASARANTARDYDRAFHPQGTARQMAAIMAHGDRRDALRELDVPTLVIHGSDDPLVHVEGGRDTAAAIPGAEFWEIPGMGHDLPVQLFGDLVKRIAGFAEKAPRRSGS
ncbi:MAG: alpha/beta fold hydrolase [bacterium]|nr:alpha/beta fold hydrolase [bacterium]